MLERNDKFKYTTHNAVNGCEYKLAFIYVYCEFEFCVLLIIDKRLLNLDEHCLFVSLYAPPEQSPFYANYTCCALQAFEELYINHDFTRYHLILNGDFNARTGNLDDFIRFDENIPELNEYVDTFNNDFRFGTM